MNKDTFVKVGVGVGLMVGLSASHAEVGAQEQTNTDNPTAVPSVEITPAIEINSPNSTETTHAIPVPTFEVPIGLAQLVDNQLQETDELEIPIDSFISWINQANPDPETVSRFENIISTFELLANDRLQDPTNPEAQVDAVDTFIELNRGEDGTVLGSLYARVLVDGLVSRDDGITPIPPDSIFTPFVTANGERQELGIMNDNDGLGTQVTLNIDLVQNGDQLTGVVVKELNGTPISILTESLDGTSQETGALEGSVSAPDGVNFRNLTGEPIGNLPFGTDMVILPEARPIPGQENLGNFYEVLVGNQVGLVSEENLTTTQNFDANTFSASSETSYVWRQEVHASQVGETTFQLNIGGRIITREYPDGLPFGIENPYLLTRDRYIVRMTGIYLGTSMPSNDTNPNEFYETYVAFPTPGGQCIVAALGIPEGREGTLTYNDYSDTAYRTSPNYASREAMELLTQRARPGDLLQIGLLDYSSWEYGDSDNEFVAMTRERYGKGSVNELYNQIMNLSSLPTDSCTFIEAGPIIGFGHNALLGPRVTHSG